MTSAQKGGCDLGRVMTGGICPPIMHVTGTAMVQKLGDLGAY